MFQGIFYIYGEHSKRAKIIYQQTRKLYKESPIKKYVWITVLFDG